MKSEFALILLNFEYVLPAVIAFVLAAKVFLFFKYKTSEWSLVNLLFFSYKNISVKTSEKANVKVIENSLSFYLLFLIVVNFAVVVYLHS